MSVSKQVYTTSRVGKDVQGYAFSSNYSPDGSSCLNGQQWSFDQYGRGPVDFASLPDTCAGSTPFVIHRLAVEQQARPEYYARLNAAGIVGYGNIDTKFDTQFGQQTQSRAYLLGLEEAQNRENSSLEGGITTKFSNNSQYSTFSKLDSTAALEREAAESQNLGYSGATYGKLSF